MVQVELADPAGFCFGVRRAVSKVYEQAALGKLIFTYGPIIHNEAVVADLEDKGVRILQSPEELAVLETGTVVIRSHGAPKRIFELLRARGLECVDATCPFVKKIHDIVSRAGEEHRLVIVLGDAGHPEVEGIVGWCSQPEVPP